MAPSRRGRHLMVQFGMSANLSNPRLSSPIGFEAPLKRPLRLSTPANYLEQYARLTQHLLINFRKE